MAEQRIAYHVEVANDGQPTLHTYEVVITPKRFAITALPRTSWSSTMYWEPRQFPGRFDWTELEAWRRYLTEMQRSRKRALESIVWIDQQIAVTLEHIPEEART